VVPCSDEKGIAYELPERLFDNTDMVAYIIFYGHFYMPAHAKVNTFLERIQIIPFSFTC